MEAPTSSPSSTSRAGAGISHSYEGPWNSMLVVLGGMLATLAAFSLIAKAGRMAGIGSRPTFLADPDSAIIGGKVGLARQPHNAGLILVGDSSCTMNLNVRALEESGVSRTVNLGLLSFLGVDSFGRVAAEGLKANPEAKKVLLAIHPDCLRLASASEVHETIFAAALDGRGRSAVGVENPVADLLGLHAFRTHVVDRWVPEPMRGAMGARFGFTEYFAAEMVANAGHVGEVATLVRTNMGSAEYRMAGRIERECAAFRKHLPPGIRLRILITPVPQSHALKSHEAKVAEMRSQLEKWLGAETPGPVMPAILPDDEFGTVTHLLPASARKYSRRLGEQLAAWN